MSSRDGSGVSGVTGPKIKPLRMPNKDLPQRKDGEYARVIVRLLTMAREADLMLFDRMENEVFRILGVRYQLPEIFR